MASNHEITGFIPNYPIEANHAVVTEEGKTLLCAYGNGPSGGPEGGAALPARFRHLRPCGRTYCMKGDPDKGKPIGFRRCATFNIMRIIGHNY